MKTNIKYMWLINLGVVTVIGLYFGVIQSGFLSEQLSSLLNWFSWTQTWDWVTSKKGLTTLSLIVITPINLLIFLFFIIPFITDLFEETTNRNVSYINKFKMLESKVETSKVASPEVKQTVLNIIKNNNKSIYKSPSLLLLTKFEGNYNRKYTQKDVDIFLRFLVDNNDKFKSFKELVTVTDSEMKAYTIYLKLNKPESMKRMSIIDTSVSQLTSEIYTLFEDKLNLDSAKLLETVGV